MTSMILIGWEGLYKEETRKSELILLRDIEVFTSMQEDRVWKFSFFF